MEPQINADEGKSELDPAANGRRLSRMETENPGFVGPARKTFFQSPRLTIPSHPPSQLRRLGGEQGLQIQTVDALPGKAQVESARRIEP
jgi:hypothetical protein